MICTAASPRQVSSAPKGKTSYADPALDFETTVGRALPVGPEHALRIIVLLLQERAAVLKQAIDPMQPIRHGQQNPLLVAGPTFIPAGGQEPCVGVAFPGVVAGP